MRYRLATLVLVMAALLTDLTCTGHSWAQTKIPRVGIPAWKQNLGSPLFREFERALAIRGWVPGKNVTLEYSVAPDGSARYDEMAAELVRLKVDVIFAPAASPLHAAYAATRTIPIVALDYTTDPVAAGYALSYMRPGKNVTGVFLDAPEMAGKWVEILRALVPGLARLAVIWDPSPGDAHLRAVQHAATSLGMRVQVQEVTAPTDFDRAFSTLHGQTQAVIILPSPITFTYSARLATLALAHRLPATSMAKAFAEAGGAVSYGPNLAETVQRNAIQVARVLEGAKPGDLPVERPSKFDFLLNMSTIKALGLTVPDSVLLNAEEVEQ
jgi:putative ABC transport system substrate-binding protein